MGFSTLLDILGSTLIGGMLLMILLRMNDTAIEYNYTYSGEKIVQQNLVELVKLLEYDFRKIGYCSDHTQIPMPPEAIIGATQDSISFLTDIVTSPGTFGDGIVDTLTYFISNDSTLNAALDATPNQNDRILYRRINSEPLRGSNMGVTQFKLTYFGSLGDTITDAEIQAIAEPPFGIASIQIDITIENPNAYGEDYSAEKKVIWRQIRLAARNFSTR